MKPQNELKLAPNSGGLFNDKTYYIEHANLYYAYFREIPEVRIIYHVNDKEFKKWAEGELKDKILKVHSKETYDWEIDISPLASNYIYILRNKIIVDIDGCTIAVLYPKEYEKDAGKIVNKAKNFKEKRKVEKSYIQIVVSSSSRVQLQKLKCKKSDFSLNENYNDDLIELHKQVSTSLRVKNEGGLFLFHGIPGTGKTSYIRYLVNTLKRNIIILPLQMAENIDTPGLVNLLTDNRNSILVIEDAERLLTSRDSGTNFGISALLNITDGLLNDSLGIKIICTFNTHLSNIDKALLRKGRLKALYEFKPLELSKTKTLLEKIGIQNPIVNEPMTLADIYNFKEQNTVLNLSERVPIGFANKVA